MSNMEMIYFEEATPRQLAALIAALDHEDFISYYLNKYLAWVNGEGRLPIAKNVAYWNSK